MLRLNKLVC